MDFDENVGATRRLGILSRSSRAVGGSDRAPRQSVLCRCGSAHSNEVGVVLVVRFIPQLIPHIRFSMLTS